MASETSHAAWQTERRFAVRVLPEDGPPADLATGLTEFLDAFDLAFEWLNREDPARNGAAALAIFETRDGLSEEVWTYPPAQPGNPEQLVARLGFDPVTWQGVPEFLAGERKRRPLQLARATAARANFLPDSSASTRSSTAVLEAPSPTADYAAEAERATSVVPSLAQPVAWLEQEEFIPTDYQPAGIDGKERATLRAATAGKWIGARARAAWDDPLSRYCLLSASVSLWLSLGFADPQFLLLLLLFLPALWWRQRDGGAPAAEADDEDWL